jgi:phage-related protein
MQRCWRRPGPSAAVQIGSDVVTLNELASPYKILYIYDMTDPKPVEFRGSSLDDLRAFPLAAKRDAGHQLDQVQNGQEPEDWKPMNAVGQGVKEIRIRGAAGAFRVIYIAKFADVVYVLHWFQKKARTTSKSDVDLAAKRYRDLLKELV